MAGSRARYAPGVPLLAATLAWCVAAWAGGWATERADASRSGYTSAPLPSKLSVRWVRKAQHPPQPAWPREGDRLPFDRAYQVSISGDMAFFGSSADCSVHALDVVTGSQRWVFATEGPVRFAPSVWRDRVFVASDDGVLYCLAASDGALLWRRRGGPVDSRVLGNDHMISRWPVRGGPAVADGLVYFAAGIWPSEGVYLYAVDAESGETQWCNDEAGDMLTAQPHSGASARSGVSACGSLVVAGDRLIVPTGRGVPAVFRRSDGKFLYFHLQRYGTDGGTTVVAAGPYFLNSHAVFDAATGSRLARGIRTTAVAVTPRNVIYAEGRTIVGRERAALFTEQESADRRGRKRVRRALADPVWEMACPWGRAQCLAVAGEAVVAGGTGWVGVLEEATGAVRLVAQVDGGACGLAVGRQRLLVSTDKGAIYCFAGGAPTPVRILGPPARGRREDPLPQVVRAAEEIATRTGISSGLCVDLACGDGSLACALAQRTKLRICAVETDAGLVARARQRAMEAGLYGVRVTVFHCDVTRTPFPSSFANLVVSGRSVTEGAEAVVMREVQRLQRPYGGAACIGRPGRMAKTLRGAPSGAASWTHQYCDPANSNCSADGIRGPLGILWFKDLNLVMPNRHGRGPGPLCHEGRLFVEGLNGLRCIDAYNGRTLWERPFPGILAPCDGEHLLGASATGSNVCVAATGLYVRRRGECLRLDPATGQPLGAFRTPGSTAGDPAPWGYLACTGGTLFGTLADTRHVVKWPYGKADMREQFTESRLLFAFDVRTGKLKWCYEPRHSIRHNAIAIGAGRVYLIDRPVALGDLLDQQAARWRGRPVKEHPPGVLVALDADDGTVLWESSDSIYGTLLALSEEHGVLIMAYQARSRYNFMLPSEVGGRMAALRAGDGKRLWDISAKYHARPVLNGPTVYADPGAWDLLTGERHAFRLTRSYGCGPVMGSRHLLLFRSATLGYVDLGHSHLTHDYGGARPGCWINAIPAGGLVLVPDATDGCRCSYVIKTSMALQTYGLHAPRITPSPGVYAGPVEVRLEHPAADAEIRYTLDGSSPTPGSPRYTGPIRLDKPAMLVVRAFAPGLPPSHTLSARFVIASK